MPTVASRAAPAVQPIAQKRECRVFERHSCGLPSQCQAASSFGSDDLKWAATLENVSQNGVCLNLRRRFEPGAALAIELPGKSAEETYTVLARVVNVRRQESGYWFLGCQFVSELSDDEMQRLLPLTPYAVPKPAKKASRTVERRSRERHEVTQLHLRLEIAPSTTIGCVIPQFAAASFWPLAAGTIGVLKGRDPSGAPWKFMVRVRDCHFQDQNWNLDCKLLKAPAKVDLLRALGGLVVKTV